MDENTKTEFNNLGNTIINKQSNHTNKETTKKFIKNDYLNDDILLKYHQTMSVNDNMNNTNNNVTTNELNERNINLETKNKKYNKNKRKPKIPENEFKILRYHEYEKIYEYNYNLNQLKEMCRYYKQKVSGNKCQLQNRLYNYLKQSIDIVKIQSIIRGYLIRNFISKLGPAIKNRNMCVNEMDFLTLERLDELPFQQFYSYRDKDNFIYGFDICSLYNLLKKEDIKPVNPYNRCEFPENIKDDLNNIIRKCHIIKYPINIEIEDDTKNMNSIEKQRLRINSLFSKIDDLGFYTNSDWFHSLGRFHLVRFIRELYDIWNYRAQLSNIVKLEIYPNGNPFMGEDFQNIYVKNLYSLRESVLNIIEKLITRGTNNSNRWLGASFCLTALTLVSKDAAESLPWFYESAI